MPTPPDWPETMKKVQEKVLDYLQNPEKHCRHPALSHVYRADFGLGYRTLMHVTCGKCDEFLGTIG